jgi:hypothetical protein
MAASQDDPFDRDLTDEELEGEMEALFMDFHEHVQGFAQERDVNDGIVSLLALRISLSARMLDYVMSTEKPSGSGLKLDLDRYRRDVDEAVRAARKGADEFVAKAKQAMAEAQPDEKPE